MENKLNVMGSEVVKGYICKPKKLDTNKPIMHFKSQIFICNGERCAKANNIKTSDLRELLLSLNLDKGANRIKITRTNCFGACRYRQVAQIIENTTRNGYLKNNNIWLKNTHLYTIQKWRELFLKLSLNEDLADFEQIVMGEIE